MHDHRFFVPLAFTCTSMWLQTANMGALQQGTLRGQKPLTFKGCLLAASLKGKIRNVARSIHHCPCRHSQETRLDKSVQPKQPQPRWHAHPKSRTQPHIPLERRPRPQPSESRKKVVYMVGALGPTSKPRKALFTLKPGAGVTQRFTGAWNGSFTKEQIPFKQSVILSIR